MVEENRSVLKNKFYIVEFVDTSSVDVMPVDWISWDGKSCLWPSVPNLLPLQRKGPDPDTLPHVKWEELRIRILHHNKGYDNFNSAHQAVTKFAEELTDWDTDIETQKTQNGKSYRRNRSQKLFDDDWTAPLKKSAKIAEPPNICLKTTPGLKSPSLVIKPACTSISKGKSFVSPKPPAISLCKRKLLSSHEAPEFSKKHFSGSPSDLVRTDSQQPRPLLDEDTAGTSCPSSDLYSPSIVEAMDDNPSSEDEVLEDYLSEPAATKLPPKRKTVEDLLHSDGTMAVLKLILTNQNMILKEIKGIKQRLDELSVKVNPDISSAPDGWPKEVPFIKNKVSYFHWEKQLLSQPFKLYAVNSLLMAGGEDMAAMTRKCMAKIFGPDLRAVLGWEGSEKKESIKSSKTVELILTAVRRRFEKASGTDVYPAIQRWLRQPLKSGRTAS